MDFKTLGGWPDNPGSLEPRGPHTRDREEAVGSAHRPDQGVDAVGVVSVRHGRFGPGREARDRACAAQVLLAFDSEKPQEQFELRTKGVLGPRDVARRGLLDSTNDWFGEGLAAWYQNRLRPMDLGAKVAESFVDAEPRRTLQFAWTVVGTLMTKHRERMPALLAAFLAANSTDREPHLGPVLSTTWEG